MYDNKRIWKTHKVFTFIFRIISQVHVAIDVCQLVCLSVFSQSVCINTHISAIIKAKVPKFGE